MALSIAEKRKLLLRQRDRQECYGSTSLSPCDSPCPVTAPPGASGDSAVVGTSPAVKSMRRGGPTRVALNTPSPLAPAGKNRRRVSAHIADTSTIQNALQATPVRGLRVTQGVRAKSMPTRVLQARLAAMRTDPPPLSGALALPATGALVFSSSAAAAPPVPSLLAGTDAGAILSTLRTRAEFSSMAASHETRRHMRRVSHSELSPGGHADAPHTAAAGRVLTADADGSADATSGGTGTAAAVAGSNRRVRAASANDFLPSASKSTGAFAGLVALSEDPIDMPDEPLQLRSPRALSLSSASEVLALLHADARVELDLFQSGHELRRRHLARVMRPTPDTTATSVAAAAAAAAGSAAAAAGSSPLIFSAPKRPRRRSLVETALTEIVEATLRSESSQASMSSSSTLMSTSYGGDPCATGELSSLPTADP